MSSRRRLRRTRHNDPMWFSALLTVAVSIDATEPTEIWRTVVVFEGDDDWETARLKAIELGRAKEATYSNAAGDAVTHRFVGVETLDMLGDDLPDGREVYFETISYDGTALPATPEELTPRQSGV
jgi:Domain of unknown function (DUF4288)